MSRGNDLTFVCPKGKRIFVGMENAWTCGCCNPEPHCPMQSPYCTLEEDACRDDCGVDLSLCYPDDSDSTGYWSHTAMGED